MIYNYNSRSTQSIPLVCPVIYGTFLQSNVRTCTKDHPCLLKWKTIPLPTRPRWEYHLTSAHWTLSGFAKDPESNNFKCDIIPNFDIIFDDPDKLYCYDTGIVFYNPPGYGFDVQSRSGHTRDWGMGAYHGLGDPPYEGSLMLMVYFHRYAIRKTRTLSAGTALASAVLRPCPKVDLVALAEPDSGINFRGGHYRGGIGSSTIGGAACGLCQRKLRSNEGVCTQCHPSKNCGYCNIEIPKFLKYCVKHTAASTRT